MKKLLILSGISTLILPLILIVLISGGDSGSINHENVSLNEEQLQFVSEVLPGALEGGKEGILPSITIAQAILESGWGKSSLAAKYKNLFGIKADPSWTGPTVDLLTQEHVNGGMITITAKWRVYTEWTESTRDHTKFLVENSRYKEHGVFESKNYVEQANALQRAGYATDSKYAELLIQQIETYSLFIYDIEPGQGNEIIEKAITKGMSIVGKSPYVFGGGRTPEDIAALRFDCSSFVHWCYANAGINLGDYRSAVTFNLVNMGTPVNQEEMKRGDLIFFNTEGVVNNHMGIYLGNNMFLHDAEKKGVGVDSLDSGYWKEALNGNIRRVIH